MSQSNHCCTSARIQSSKYRLSAEMHLSRNLSNSLMVVEIYSICCRNEMKRNGLTVVRSTLCSVHHYLLLQFLSKQAIIMPADHSKVTNYVCVCVCAHALVVNSLIPPRARECTISKHLDFREYKFRNECATARTMQSVQYCCARHTHTHTQGASLIHRMDNEWTMRIGFFLYAKRVVN